MSAIAKRDERLPVLRPPVGLRLSIGEPAQPNRPGRAIDYFRAKEGEDHQYAQAAAKFHEVYGDRPAQLPRISFLSDEVPAVLDIRVKAWGSSGIRLVGHTNYAELPPLEWEQAAFALDDDVTFFALNAKEVAREVRDTWNGEPIVGKLEGRDDARVEKLGINVEATLTFLIDEVMGVGLVAEITTKSRNSMRNLYNGVWAQWRFFNGHLAGIPFRLSLVPKNTRRFDAEKKQYFPTKIHALVLDTEFTRQQVIDLIRDHRDALGQPLTERRQIESQMVEQMLQLPAGTDVNEAQQLRDEPAPESVDDARLNRLARLEDQAGHDAVRAVLVGVFGVEAATDLSPEDAERYEQVLARTVASDVEVVDDADVSVEDEGSPFERMAREARERSGDAT